MSGSPTRWLLGCVTNLSLHWPEMVVVSELGAASVMSLPGGPWKSLACFAWTAQLTTAGLHATSATTVTASERPGWSVRFRRRMVLPTTVTVAGEATDAERSTMPAGTVRSAEPSCCFPSGGLVNVAENSACVPAGTVAGERLRV